MIMGHARCSHQAGRQTEVSQDLTHRRGKTRQTFCCDCGAVCAVSCHSEHRILDPIEVLFNNSCAGGSKADLR
jgi:hypothetical protein